MNAVNRDYQEMLAERARIHREEVRRLCSTHPYVVTVEKQTEQYAKRRNEVVGPDCGEEG
jgi:hypothetical protein